MTTNFCFRILHFFQSYQYFLTSLLVHPYSHTENELYNHLP